MDKLNTFIEQLNAPEKEDRLRAAEEIAGMIKSGEIPAPERNEDTNNHVHIPSLRIPPLRAYTWHI